MKDMFTAAATNDYQLVASYLTVFGNYVDEKNDTGLTCLHISSACGAFETVQVLLECGANVMIKDRESGWTPLHRAFYFGHPKIALLLIACGASVGINEPPQQSSHSGSSSKTHLLRDNDGMTPIEILTYKLHLSNSSLHDSDWTTVRKGLGALYAFGKSDITLGVALPKAVDVVRPKHIDSLMRYSVSSIYAGKYHCLALTSEGALFSWGHGRGGRLGHGDEVSHPEPRQVMHLANERLVMAAISESHSLVVSSEGQVYSWGSNRFGQLGLGDAEHLKNVFTPKRIESLKRERVLGLACGDTHSLCYTRSNEVFSWGCNKHGQLGLRFGDCTNSTSGPCAFIPKKVILPLKSGTAAGSLQSDTLHVCAVAAAYSSSLVLCRSRKLKISKVYQWGDGVKEPRNVPFSQRNAFKRANSNDANGLLSFQSVSGKLRYGNAIVQLAAGRHHFAALSADGVVYTWGLHGDLLGQETSNYLSQQSISQPQPVEALLPECCGSRVVQVCCADDRSCAVTLSGDVFSWGAADSKGVLSSGQSIFQPFPRKMDGIKRASAVALAESFTMVLVHFVHPLIPAFDIFDAEPLESLGIKTCRAARISEDSVDSDLSDEEERSSQPYVEIPGPMISGFPKLQQLCEVQICRGVTMKNVLSGLAFAEMFHADILRSHCMAFINSNLDAVLAYAKPAELDKAVNEWKLPMSVETLCSSHRDLGNGRSSSGSFSVVPVKDLGMTNSRERMRGSSEVLESGIAKPLTKSVSEEDLKRQMKRALDIKNSELEAVQTVTELQKLMRATKKKLAGIEELLSKQKQGEYKLTAEQEEKVSKRSLFQAELALMEQYNVRLEMRNKKQPSTPLAPDEITAPPAKAPLATVKVEATSLQSSISTSSEQRAPSKPVVEKKQPSYQQWTSFTTTSSSSKSAVASEATSTPPAKSKKGWDISPATLSSASASGRTVLSPTDPALPSKSSTPVNHSVASSSSAGSPFTSASQFSTTVNLDDLLNSKSRRKQQAPTTPPSVHASTPTATWKTSTPAASAWSASKVPINVSAGTPGKTVSSVASPAAPRTPSLLEIVAQEEKVRQNSTMATLRGNDIPWLVERRERAKSFERLIEQQREEAEIAEQMRIFAELEEREKKLQRDAARAAQQSRKHSKPSKDKEASTAKDSKGAYNKKAQRREKS